MANPKVPREKVSWFPTVIYDACIHDRECINFFKNNAFDWNEALDVPEVVNPYNCVLGCDSWKQICPSEAISFPSREELRAVIRRSPRRVGRPRNRLAHRQGYTGRQARSDDSAVGIDPLVQMISFHVPGPYKAVRGGVLAFATPTDPAPFH